jgi:hypothetical protein
MKVYSISKWAFWGICLLIVILPVSRHWKLLTTGERVDGTVTGMVIRPLETRVVEPEISYVCEIVFEADDSLHRAFGPPNFEYATGRNIRVYYDPADPSRNCLFTFSGFYLESYTALPVALLMVWAAFYLSFNNYRKKQRFKKGRFKQTQSTGGPEESKVLPLKK